MKRSKFTEQQIAFAFALRQAGTGTRVVEICRKMGISEAPLYNWKKKFGGLSVAELRRLRQLEDENRRLKQMVADLSLDKQMLQEVIAKSSEDCQATPSSDFSSSYLPGESPTGLCSHANEPQQLCGVMMILHYVPESGR